MRSKAVTGIKNGPYSPLGLITHSAKETRQQKQQWRQGLEVTGIRERGGQNLKKGAGGVGRGGGLHKIGGVRTPLPAKMLFIVKT